MADIRLVTSHVMWILALIGGSLGEANVTNRQFIARNRRYPGQWEYGGQASIEGVLLHLVNDDPRGTG